MVPAISPPEDAMWNSPMRRAVSAAAAAWSVAMAVTKALVLSWSTKWRVCSSAMAVASSGLAGRIVTPGGTAALGVSTGTVGSIDTTIKDLKLGGTQLSADRLHFDGIDTLEVTFDGFRPTSVTMVVHRVTATNLAIKIGDRPQPKAEETVPTATATTTGRVPRM